MSRVDSGQVNGVGGPVAERCPGCDCSMPNLRIHMKRCCPELLGAGKAKKRRAPELDGDCDWISEEEMQAGAKMSIGAMEDPLFRRVLELRFGFDRGGGRRTPLEVAEALGKKHAKTGEAAQMLIRSALRSIPLIPDDPKDLQVLFEDDQLLAVMKPPHLRTTPVHRFVGRSLTNQLVGYLEAAPAKPTDSQGSKQKTTSRAPNILHRLDQNTSGVVLCAKTKEAARFMNERWHTASCDKEYLAVASRTSSSRLVSMDDSVLVTAPIGRDVTSDDPVRRAVNFDGGQSAATRFRVLAVGPQAMLLSCKLEESGRTHQIRVHAAHVGMPLVGDDQYGVDFEGMPPIARVALHAWRVRCTHPVSLSPLLLEAPLPADMEQCLATCGLVWSA